MDDNLALSGFVIIEDTNCPYVAQVVSLKADTPINTAIVRLLFTFDSEGVLKNYNGTIPSIKASISKLPSNELLDVMPVETPIKLGALAQQGIPLFVDKTAFEHNMVVCCNKQENINTFVNNILPQFDAIQQKTVVIDVDGEFDYENKFEFGYDFKLPLNYTTLEYIFDNDLGDVDATSKAVIQDIFYEVQEYSKTLPLGFIPFNTFLEVVDAQYKETKIPELVLLKNKLLKYKEENVFALNSVEITDLVEEIKHSNITVLNISKVEGELQKQVISYIYDTMAQTQETVYSIIKLNNYIASKRLIKRFIDSGNVRTSIICGYEFKYLQELKQYAENMLFFAPLTTQHDFAAYNIYLAKLNPEEFIAFGDATQEIPFIIELEEFSQEDLQPKVYIQGSHVQSQEDYTNEEDFQNANDNYLDLATTETEYETEVVENPLENFITEPQPTEIPSSQSIEDLQQDQYEILEEEKDNNSDIVPDSKEDIVETPSSQTSEELNISESENLQDSLSTQQEEVETEGNSTDITISAMNTETFAEPTEDINNTLSDFSAQEKKVDEEQIIKDVDDILYNKKDINEDIPPLEDEEEITEDDLNLIDNLNNPIPAAEGEETTLNIEPVIVEDEQLEAASEASDQSESDEISQIPNMNEQMQEEETTNEDFQPAITEDEDSQTVVPVYPANDIPQDSTGEIFNPGDQVSHPKYGNGVVEKMIKYGNKVLCSINFENIGRRLLDPAISEITKL